MIKNLNQLLRLASALLIGASTHAQTPATATPENSAPAADNAPEKPLSLEESYAKAGIKIIVGPKTVPIGKVAEINLPEGFGFIPPDQIKTYSQLTQNLYNPDKLGVIISPEDWEIHFTFSDDGFVKDEEKAKLAEQSPKLLETITQNVADSNTARRAQNYPELRIQGWAQPPHYDEKNNNLKWAINLASSSDNYKSIGINESIRLLGRTGVMNVTVLANSETFKSSSQKAGELLASNFNFVSGQKYAEFKPGDKIAQYGLAALVLGGAGAVALKTGLFASLIAGLGKAWKVVVAGLVAVGVGIQKLFKRLAGKKDDDQHPPLRG